ncbi:hypothetical protein [Arvimicrobium flavum]|uniref:hypothetical protein n=1 Tax=Arvimicrobium flavum TaxID=3393320 RepID=UPI00237C5161|nr:hypothetical protein [Mesorhizobium shangrilense]
MSSKFTGGLNIAMKVPPHQMAETVRFYRDVVGLEPYVGKGQEIGFKLGPNRLWIDEAPMQSQAEVWLELFTDDHEGALADLESAGVVRCDAIETLPEGFKGGWISNPAGIVHMVRTPDAW